MKTTEVMPVGVVVERREIDNSWQDYEWQPVAVFPGAPEVDDWRGIEEGDGWIRFHAATLPLELHRGETEAYKVNLSYDPPGVYVVLRDKFEDEDEDDHEVRPFLATVSPYEAQDYLDAGDDIIERVPMPDGMIAWIQAFIDQHHVDEPFHKRKLIPTDKETLARGKSSRRRGNGNGRDG